MKNFYSKIKTLARAVVMTGALMLGYAQAQTTLSPGGIAFTSYDSNSTSVDVFSFVLLTPISSSTQISFTDRGYQGSNTWQVASATESTVTWTSGTALPAGTEVYISGLSSFTYNPSSNVSTANGTVALTEGSSSNGLSLSSVGDQVIAFQGGSGSVTGAGVTCIAGINYFYTTGSSTAAWNSDAVGSPNASLMPPGLTGGTNAFYTGPVTGNTLAKSGKFDCTGVPASSAANIRTAVMTMSSWILSTAAGSQYSGCTFLASTPVITANPANRTICAGGNTTFTVGASGATSYQWYQNSGSGFIALTNTAPYSGVTTNTLTITGATAAMNGYQYRAVASGSGSATSNAGTLTVTSISTTGSVTTVACNGGSNGTATVVPSGGVAPYTYSWSPVGGTSATATGLSAGSYTVTVTDNLGCQTTRTFTVTQPSAIVSSTVITNIACNGASNGSIDLTVSGGVPPYTYNWGGGITTEDRTGLAAGTYTVIITDANGCTKTVNSTVTQPASAVSGTTVVTNVACNGASNGSINLTPAGGTAPYTFNWGGGITTEDRTGLAAGTYTVIITDANGCTATVNATVTQPASAVSGTTVVTNVACNGASNGSINLTPAGGTAPYTFNWGGGITTEDRTGLAAGTYTVTITDANGCTATVNATVTQPASAVSGTTVVTNVACNGASNGSINLTPAGGTAPYTFNWGGGITTEDRTGLAAGTYTVTITDANGCTATVNATVTQPTALSATTSQTNVSCNGGSTGTATITVTGGTAPYVYSWSPSGGTAATASGLAAGTYTVTVTDAKGCTLSRTFTITQSAPVAAPTGAASQNFAPGSTLSALVVTGQNIKWYASASDAQNHVNSLPLTTALVNNTTYYATQTPGTCESTAYLAVLAINSTLGVADNTKPKSQLQIYPNPVREILNFSGTETITKAVIIAADGRLVTEKKLQAGERSIDVQALPQGMYLIQVFTGNGTQTFKFIKK